MHAAIRDAVPATVPPGDSGRHPLDRLGLGAVPEFLPPLLVDDDLVVKETQQDAVCGAGLAAVLLVLDVVHVTG